MKNELVSIIVPVYQVKPYLKKCMDSLIHQSYENIEIILVDDGSTDGGGDICDEYARKDKRVQVIHKENEGLSAARNSGIDVAKGQYLAFVDSDDWVDHSYIRTMYEALQETDSDMVQCELLEVFDEDTETENQTVTAPIVFTGREFSYATYTLLSWKCNLAWNKLYKKELFENVRYPKGKIHEDEFTTYKLIWKAKKVALVSGKLYFYRQRMDSIMGKPYSLKRLDAGEAYQERIAFYTAAGENELAAYTKKVYSYWITKQMEALTQKEEFAEIADIQRKKKEELEEELSHWNLKGTNPIEYVFPFGQIAKGSNVVLYGAGDIGKQFFRQIVATNYCSISAWIDANYSECKKNGIPAQGLSDAAQLCKTSDYVVIAIVNGKVALDVIEMLVSEYNIPREKIIFQNVRLK